MEMDERVRSNVVHTVAISMPAHLLYRPSRNLWKNFFIAILLPIQFLLKKIKFDYITFYKYTESVGKSLNNLENNYFQ